MSKSSHFLRGTTFIKTPWYEKSEKLVKKIDFSLKMCYFGLFSLGLFWAMIFFKNFITEIFVFIYIFDIKYTGGIPDI